MKKLLLRRYKMKRTYYRMNINVLQIQDLNPLKFEHIVMKKM